MADNRNIVLSAKDIEVKFRVRDNYLTAIRGVSLDLYEGETFAIVGESGSGKSVFTKTFTGMLESNGSITNGSVMFEGKDLTKLKTDKDWEGIRGAKISTIFQDPMTSLNPIRTIGSQITEVIEKHQGISRGDAKKQAIELMERVGIQNAADRFDDAIKAAIEQRNDEAVIDYHRYPDADYAVPTPDHFLPLLYILGASKGETPYIFNNVRNLGSMALTGYAFGL